METYYTNLNKKIDRLQTKKRQLTRTSHNNPEQHQFYKKFKNLTNIKSTTEEIELLNYGLQYSFEKPLTTYFTYLITETEKSIKLLDTKLQNSYRHIAANKLKQIINSGNNCNIIQKRRLRTMKQQNQKLVTENAILVQADKGKKILIIKSDTYSYKVHAFLAANKFSLLPIDPTDKYKKQKKTLQQCNLITAKQKIKYLTQKSPTPSTLKTQLKLHNLTSQSDLSLTI